MIDLDKLSQTAPDIDLGERRAWRIPREDGRPSLRGWLLESPGFYPVGMFAHYVIGVASLERRPEWAEPVLYTPDAVAELAIYGLRLAPAQYMTPPEIVVQVCNLEPRDVLWLADVALVAALGNCPPPIVDLAASWHRMLREWVEHRGGRLELPPSRAALRFA